MKKIYKQLLVFIFMLLLCPLGVKAASASLSLTGGTATVGNNVTVTLKLNRVDDGSNLQAVGGYVNFDTNYLEMVSCSTSLNYQAGNKKFAYIDMTGVGIASGNVGTCTFKAKTAGTTTVTFQITSAATASSEITAANPSASITINNPTPVTPKSSNFNLASLAVEGFSLSPAFSASTKSYTVTVPRDTTSVKIIATVEDSKATLTGDGTKSLTGETTTLPIKVTAEDGTSTTYTVNVKKEAEEEPVVTPKSNDSSLKKLDVSGYTLTPAFKSTETTYSMKVGSNISGLNVTAIPNDSKATVSISGNKSWQVGQNTITIKVTAEDGSQTIYTVNVTRQAKNEKSSDTNIDFRIVSPHIIKPEYSNSLNEFEVTVPNDVTKLETKITPYDKKTKVSVSGGDDLKLGVINPVTITVTAEDGTKRVITLNVIRDKEKANTDLLDLKVKNHTLDPVFKPNITEYKVNIKYNEKKLEFIVKAPKGAKYKIIGNKNFEVGKNTVLIKVTDKNDYVNYYRVEVNKAAKKLFLGIGIIPFIIILLLLLLLLLLLFLLLKRKKKKQAQKEVQKEKEVVIEHQSETPVIDFKPQFNFNSNNGTDDDVIYSEGNLINGTDVQKLPEYVKPAEEVYDIYDDVVTKDELYDAINEGIETKNPEKLKLLLAQEKLNRKKEAIKEMEEKTRSSRYKE